MRSLALLIIAVLAVAPASFAGADRSLNDAWMAQRLIGTEAWSRVLRIENENPRSPYPRVVHALVFEVADLLWFYTDTDGTQSLSLHRGQLAREKADLAPLLLAIDPGFRRWTIVPETVTPAPGRATALKNGCFIESVVLARSLAVRQRQPRALRLLSYYATRDGADAGHTVLACVEAHAVDVFDSDDPSSPRRLPLRDANDALRLARDVAGPFVAKARFLPLPDDQPKRHDGWVAAEPRTAAMSANKGIGG